MGQVWDGSKWVVRAGAPEPPPEPDAETGDEKLPDDEAAPNGEENDAET